MSRTLCFERLVVRRLPGFREGGPDLADLDPGVNLILGPNESGKSTTARALQGVLWPEILEKLYPEGPIDIEATLAWQGSRWTVHLERGRVRWQRDGAEHPTGPALPPPERARRYLLSLQDLVAADDRPLAGEIRRLSAGGVDFAAAYDSLDLRAGGVPTGARSAWRAARDDLQKAIGEADALRSEERRLPTLEAELADIRARAATLPIVERLEELAAARTAVEEAEARLASFPGGMEALRSGDDEAWTRLEHDGREAGEQLLRAEKQAERAQARLDETRLGDAPPDARVTARLRELDVRARELGRELDTARSDLSGAEAAEADAREALGLGPGLEPAAALPNDVLDRLEPIMEEGRRVQEAAARVETRRAALRAELEGGPDDPGEVDAGISRAAEVQEVLRQWQGAGDGVPSAGLSPQLLRPVALVLVAVGLVLAVVGLVRGVSPDPLVAGAGAVVAAAGLALLFGPRPVPVDPRQVARERARNRGIEHDDWTPEGVRRRLDEISRDVAGLHHRRRTLEELQRIEAEEVPAVRARLAAWREQVHELNRAVGLGEGTRAGPVLERVVPLLVSWDRAHNRWVAARGACAGLETALGAVLREASQVGGPWFPSPSTPAALHGAVTRLSEAVRDHGEATERLAGAREAAAQASSRVAEVRRRREEMLRRLGCGEDEVERVLSERIPRLAAWQEARDTRRVARATVHRLESGLDAHPGAGALVASVTDAPTGRIDTGALSRLREAAQLALDRVRELQETIGGIRRAVADGRSRHDVEEHMARRDAAAAELAAWRDRERDKAVARALLGHLRRETEARSRPRVLSRAMSLMAAITGGRYTLTLADDAEGGFRAVFQESGEGRALDELSSGTRVQLLLAVRLAFVEVQEGEGAALPLLLDEVLGTSDDDRARAIVQAAAALARRGRQLLYFTAQADEVHKWRGAVETEGGEGRLHTLAPPGHRTVDPSPALVWEPPAEILEAVPPPEDDDHQTYGARLGVRPLQLWAPRPVHALHPWHLTEDPAELHLLLVQGLRTWAQVETFVTHAGDAADDRLRSTHARMRPLAALCGDFVELARRGRGRPVNRAVLEGAEAVSEVWIDRLSDLCADLEGDARRLMDALDAREDERVKGFRSDKIELLREELVAGGHLALDAPLDPRALLTRLVARAQRFEAPPSPAEVERLIRRWSAGP